MRNIQESAGEYVEVVWACFEKRIGIRRQESDGDGGAGKKRRCIPKRRWLDRIRNDLSERGLSGEDAQDKPR